MLKVKLTILAISAVCCCAAESASWSDRAPLIRTDACEGLPLSLTCRNPPGRISWFKMTDTNKLLQITPDDRIKIDVNGTLQFTSVDVTDTAVYKCGVLGSSNIKLGSQVNLKVIKAGSTSWSDRAPLITKYGYGGLPLSLTCRKPPPGRISWFKETDTKELSQIIPDYRLKIDVKGTLQFSSVDVTDTAVYKCSVSASSNFTLGSPVNLKVRKVDTTNRDKEQITKTASVTQSNSSRTIKTVSKEDTETFQFTDKGTVVSTPDVTTLHEVASASSWPSALIGALVGIIIMLVLIGTIGVVLIRRMKKSDNPLSCPGKEDGGIQRDQATPSTSDPTYDTHVLES